MKTNNEQFYEFMRRCGNDKMEIADVMINNEIIVDDKQKAVVFNDYFQSVFLPTESVTYGSCPITFSVMPPVEFGVLNFWNINEVKAIGLDGILPRILKRCANAIPAYLFITHNE